MKRSSQCSDLGEKKKLAVGNHLTKAVAFKICSDSGASTQEHYCDISHQWMRVLQATYRPWYYCLKIAALEKITAGLILQIHKSRKDYATQFTGHFHSTSEKKTNKAWQFLSFCSVVTGLLGSWGQRWKNQRENVYQIWFSEGNALLFVPGEFFYTRGMIGNAKVLPQD